MMLTPEQLVKARICTEAELPAITAEDCLTMESALEWLGQRTTLNIKKIALADLPAGAKVFLVKYRELMERYGVSSESIEQLSQSFLDKDLEDLLSDLAESLLPEYFQVFQFVPRPERWKYGRPGRR